MEYKQIVQIETHYSSGFIGLQLHGLINREITASESFYMMNALEAVAQMLRRNDLMNDKEYLKEITNRKNQLIGCFMDADKIYVHDAPNQYSKNHDVEPWYKVWTNKGPITIGWRKRVISIDWTESDVKADASLLFPAENVTKSGNSIHANGYEMAKAYLQVILST